MSTIRGHTPFVGREQELRHLQAAFDDASAGHGGLVMVVGEPGIGKTTLCKQLAAYAEAKGGRVLAGHCYEEGSFSLPYLAFVEALRSHVVVCEREELRQELGDGAADVARIVPELGTRLDAQPRPSGDPEYDRYRLLQSVTAFLRAIAADRPLLLLLEDLHNADRGTLDQLLHIVRHVDEGRLLVAGTYRDVEVDRAHPLSAALADLRRTSRFDRVLLRGLSPDEVRGMVNRLAGKEAPGMLAEAVHRQTEGNPLFVQEVVRFLLDEGRIDSVGEAELAAGSVPQGLRDVIGKRLSRLSPECNRLLSVAAVIGREFDLTTLQAVAGPGVTRVEPPSGRDAGRQVEPTMGEGRAGRVPQFNEETLLAGLEEAVRASVVEEEERPGVIRYRFTHAFFRQTLYEELIAPRRLRLHQQVARALETQHARRLDEHAVELAEHFAHSTDPADLGKAVSYGERAARHAMEVYAYGEAVRLLERALQVQDVLDPDDNAQRCDLVLALGEALLSAGELRRVVDEVAPQALTLAEAVPDDRHASRACQLALEALTRFGGEVMERTPEYGRWAEQADRHADPGTAERVLADNALAIHWSVTGRRGAAWALHEHALALARTLDDPQILFATVWPALVHANTIRHNQELFHLAREFCERPREGVHAGTLTRLLVSSHTYLLAWGERARAEDVEHDIAKLGERTQDAFILMHPFTYEIVRATVDGHLEEALAAGARLIARSEDLGMPVRGKLLVDTITARALVHLGYGEEALARAIARGSEPSQEAVCLAHLGRRAEVQAALQRYIQEHDVSDAAEIAVSTLTLLLEAAVLAEDRDVAAVLVPQLARFSAMSNAHIAYTCPARHLGAAAALLGDREQALAYYAQALEAAGKIRFRPEIALTHLQIAEMLHNGNPSAALRAGVEEQRQAQEHLEFAVTEFREMKMRPALERAVRLQERLGTAKPGRVAPANPGGLSDREVDVLRRIAAGQSNQEIADALIVSVRTVERHAVNIYAKIGARGRTDAVAYAVRHNLTDAVPN